MIKDFTFSVEQQKVLETKEINVRESEKDSKKEIILHENKISEEEEQFNIDPLIYTRKIIGLPLERAILEAKKANFFSNLEIFSNPLKFQMRSTALPLALPDPFKFLLIQPDFQFFAFGEVNKTDIIHHLQKSLIGTGKGILKVSKFIRHPGVSIPLNITLAYKKEREEDALLNATCNGVMIWVIGRYSFTLLNATAGFPVALSAILGNILAEITPSVSELAGKHTKYAEEMQNLNEDYLIDSEYLATQGQLQMLSWVQKGFRAIGAGSIWNECKSRIFDDPDKPGTTIAAHLSEGLKADMQLEAIKLQFINNVVEASGPQLATYFNDAFIESPNLQAKIESHLIRDFWNRSELWKFNSELKTLFKSMRYLPALLAGDDLKINTKFELSNELCQTLVDLELDVPERKQSSLPQFTESEKPKASSEGEAKDKKSETKQPPLLYSIDYCFRPSKEADKPLTFYEQSRIKDFKISLSAAGGGSILMTAWLMNGTQISATASLSGTVTVGATVPLTLDGLVESVFAAVPYVAGLLAILSAAKYLAMQHQKDIHKHMKEDHKNFVRDSEEINKQVEGFNEMIKQLHQGQIDIKMLTQKADDIAALIASADESFRESEHYALHHKNSGAATQYALQRANLVQMGLDLRRITQHSKSEQQIIDEFIPTLGKTPTEELISHLTAIAKQPFLSYADAIKQEAIKIELVDRIQAGKVGDLSHKLTSLVEQPKGHHISVKQIAKPTDLFKKQINSAHAGRRSIEIKKWADGSTKTYDTFISTCERGASLEEIEKAGEAALTALAFPFANIRLKHTKTGEVDAASGKMEAIKTAGEYYTPYIQEVTASIKEKIAQARGIAEGAPSGEATLFTKDEMDGLLFIGFFADYKNAQERLPSEGDTAFAAMAQAARHIKPLLTPLNDADNSLAKHIDNVLFIESKYGTFSGYQSATERRSMIAEHIETLLRNNKVFNDPQADEAALEKAWGEEKRAAAQLTELGLTLNDIEEATLSGEPEQAYEDIDRHCKQVVAAGSKGMTYASYRQACARLDTIRSELIVIQENIAIVNNTTVDKHARLLAQKALEDAADHLKDLNLSIEDMRELAGGDAEAVYLKVKETLRGISHQKLITRYQQRDLPLIYSPLTSFALHILNDLHNFEGRETLKKGTQVLRVIHGLFSQVIPCAIAYPVAAWCGEGDAVGDILRAGMVNPLSLRGITSLNKGSRLCQKGALVTQLCAMGARVYFPTAITKGVVHTAQAMTLTSSFVSYVNLGNKIWKYYGHIDKFNKIASSCVGVVAAIPDLYDLMATELMLPEDQNEWGISDYFMNYLKGILPQSFQGNLSESAAYYAFRDVAQSAALITLFSMSLSPLLGTPAICHSACTAYNLLTGKYTRDALCAIMLNHNYNNNEKHKNEKACNESFANLENYLASDEVKSSHSIIAKRARAFHFDIVISKLQDEKKWEQILAKTDIEIGKENICYKGTAIEVSSAPAAYQMRCLAFMHLNSAKSNLGEMDDFLRELKILRNRYDKTTFSKCVIEGQNRCIARYLNHFLNRKFDTMPTLDHVFGFLKPIKVSDADALLWYAIGCLVIEALPKNEYQEGLQVFIFNKVDQFLKEKINNGIKLSEFENVMAAECAKILSILIHSLKVIPPYNYADKPTFGKLMSKVLV